MQQTLFDHYGNYEIPYMMLCNPDKSELYSIGLAYDTKVTLRFNAIGEITFSFPKSIDGGQTTLEAYEFIKNKRLVLLENIGYFIITDAEEDSNGTIPIKKVSCKSLETELIAKRLTAYGGTKKLYDLLDSTGTILYDMIHLAPNWSVFHVDAELFGVYRTFNVADSNVYNFLMNDVENAFECVFKFDIINRTISAYTIENATLASDIFLSFDNILKQTVFTEKSDEISTALSVYGAGNLNVRSVNPLGTDKIYDFSYYATTDWMTSGLVSAIVAWDALVDSQQTPYANLLTLLSGFNAEFLVLRSDLAQLNSDLLSLDGLKKVRIQAGLSYSDINVQITAKQAEIISQESLISNKQGQINETILDLQDINTLVSFSNNFTEAQLLELNTFIFENTYKNENIIQTDSMNLVEVQAAAQALYNQAISVLARVSQPRYEISMDATNYIFLHEFSQFTGQTQLGTIVTSEIKEGIYAETVLLEISYSVLNPTDFTMTFSNRLRLDGEDYKYSDLMGSVQKTGASVAFDSLKWSNWENDYKNSVATFIASALDATVNNLISNSNQEILINQNGLIARNSDGAGGYSPKQAWLVNNVLAFSDDGFQTAKLALGEISLPAGGTGYGLVADVIVGRLLAGASLTISNETNNFLLDSSGAFLTNASFTISNTNTKIFLDPNNGIKIQANQGGTWVNKFFVDATGNITFSGTLMGATGTFSGTLSASVGNIGTLIIDSQGLKTSDGNNWLRGNGDLKWGGLSISGSSATFNGTIFADKLVGQVVDSQVASGLNAGKVTNGSMSGNRIVGGTATVSGISAVGGSLAVEGLIVCSLGGTFGGLTLLAHLAVAAQATFGGNIVVAGGTGLNQTVSVTTPFGTRYLTFSRGIFVGYSS